LVPLIEDIAMQPSEHGPNSLTYYCLTYTTFIFSFGIFSFSIFLFGCSEESVLEGRYQERFQISCENEERLTDEQRIGELRIEGNGTFSVTWEPYESYKDYWGDFEYDDKTTQLVLTITQGNDIPDNFDGTGTATFNEADELVLKDIWLGREPKRCGHVFGRYSE